MLSVPALMQLPARDLGRIEGLASILESSLHLPKSSRLVIFSLDYMGNFANQQIMQNRFKQKGNSPIDLVAMVQL